MRKTVVLVVLAAASVAVAQPESFRSMSTSGLIFDDLDLWMSNILHTDQTPDRLVEIEGYRIYSGIANLSSGDDRIFDEDEDGEAAFMLGGSVEITPGKFVMAGLMDFFDDRIMEEITLMAPGGELVSGEGEVEGTYSVFTDENGDGVLDTRHTVHQQATGWTDSITTGFSLHAGIKPGPSWQMGLALGYLKHSITKNPSDINYTNDTIDSNLVTGLPTYQSLETSSGLDKLDFTHMSASISGRGVFSELLTAGGFFNFVLISGNSEYTEDANGFWDNAPDEPDLFDELVWSVDRSDSKDLSGNAFGGGAELAFNLSEIWKLEVGGSYHLTGFDGTTGNYQNLTDSLFQTTVGSLLETEHIVGTGTGNLIYDYSDNLIAAGAKITAVPNDFTTVSFGLGIGMWDNTVTETIEASMQTVDTFDDGDEEFADPDDFTATTTWSQTDQTKTTVENTTISIPVGIEVDVLPKVVLRLGASPGFVNETETETTSLLEASPATTTVVYGDGTTNEYVTDPWTTYDGTLSTTSETRTEIPFSYGIGFSPTESVQIDIMGFDGDLSEWRLSATIKF